VLKLVHFDSQHRIMEDYTTKVCTYSLCVYMKMLLQQRIHMHFWLCCPATMAGPPATCLHVAASCRVLLVAATWVTDLSSCHNNESPPGRQVTP
jgi:hypothetical protein